MDMNQIGSLAQRYQTPLYAFDVRILKERLSYLRSKMPRGVNLCYAVKANTFISGELDPWVDRFEICSPGEEYICDRQGLAPEKMVISGVYKTPGFIEDLVAHKPGVGWYTVESPVQYRLLKSLAEKHGAVLPVLLRLTSGCQFGMDEADVISIIKEKPACLDIRGIQYFSGTQKHSLKRLTREISYVDDFMQRLQADYGFTCRELEFGPGFQVCYFVGDEYDEDAFLEGFADLLNGMTFKAEVTLEMGRAIAACCGTYLTSVVDSKTCKKQNYAIVDGGMHQLVYYGQSMAMKHPVCSRWPQKPDDEPTDWNICGSLCTTNDILVKQLPFSHLEVGDVLAFEKTGAYCMTEGISLFLSRDLPKVVMIQENGETVLVRDTVYTDPLNTPVYERKD